MTRTAQNVSSVQWLKDPALLHSKLTAHKLERWRQLLADVVIINAPVYHLSVIITGVDKKKILSQCKYQGYSVTRLSHILGINRTYFYQCLDAQRFEVSKLIHLQAILGLKIISREDVESAYNRLVDSFYAHLPSPMVQSNHN